MKRQFTLTAILAITLTACGSGEKAAAPVEAKVDGTAKAAPADNAAVTKEFMVGKWALESDGNCKLSQHFKADGSVDGLYDSWKLDGDTLVGKLGDESITMTVKKIDDTHVEATVNGDTQRMVRC